MAYLSDVDEATGLFDAVRTQQKGSELHESYLSAKPFSHVVIDDFLPESLLERCLCDFPSASEAEYNFNRSQERFKRSYSPDSLGSASRQFFYSLNSQPFLQFIENVTGIKGLIPDPLYHGGGFHEIAQGGHLSVHADFNHHERLNLERRVNVLIYLNKDWKASYGGQLELWDRNMTQCVKSYIPCFNRCVIFSTTSHNNHGNPQPVQHPDHQPRRSIALYYYTASWDRTRRSHTTQFKVRPRSGDRPDREIRNQELLQDLFPPILLRQWMRLRKFRERRYSR
jgi:Rps23 Pro-64 3,4-dihydroxylase Tpa1-like proline 4-hydroxylase